MCSVLSQRWISREGKKCPHVCAVWDYNQNSIFTFIPRHPVSFDWQCRVIICFWDESWELSLVPWVQHGNACHHPLLETVISRHSIRMLDPSLQESQLLKHATQCGLLTLHRFFCNCFWRLCGTGYRQPKVFRQMPVVQNSRQEEDWCSNSLWCWLRIIWWKVCTEWWWRN